DSACGDGAGARGRVRQRRSAHRAAQDERGRPRVHLRGQARLHVRRHHRHRGGRTGGQGGRQVDRRADREDGAGQSGRAVVRGHQPAGADALFAAGDGRRQRRAAGRGDAHRRHLGAGRRRCGRRVASGGGRDRPQECPGMMQMAAFTRMALLPYDFPGPKIPLPQWVNTAQRWSADHLSFLTVPLSDFVKNQVFAGMNAGLEWIWPPVLMLIVAAFAFFASGRRWVLPVGRVIGMRLLWSLGLWSATIQTFSLVLLATVVAVAIGLPIGIAAALSPTTRRIITPILDFMQTMPAFVYLLPAIPFFGLGAFSAIIATVVFSTPPCVRLITLGILQVPEDLIEAADSFGSTRRQKLFKVQLPMAMPTIMAGV